eukprot:scaffold5250_cov102-Isochrysis_galbana.AAC.4
MHGCTGSGTGTSAGREKEAARSAATPRGAATCDDAAPSGQRGACEQHYGDHARILTANGKGKKKTCKT